MAATLAALASMLLLPAPLRAQDEETVSYAVKKGDTLYGLARLYLTSDGAALRVQRLNRIAEPRRLPVGKQLRIPRELLRYTPVELRVAGFSGQVDIAGRVPAVGAVLNERQIVTTGRGGFVSFRAANGGEVALPSNTRAQLLRARRYLLGDLLDVDFAVLGGRGEAKAPKLRSGERFRLRTPTTVTAVRGTEFRVAYDEAGERSLAEVIEGTVAVAAGEKEIPTPAGFGVTSTAEGAGQLETLLPPPVMIDPGAVQTGQMLGFAIEPDSKAKGFRIQLARDAGFLEVVGEQVTGNRSVTFPPLDNGRYFVRARTIAASDLEGFSEAYSFRRKRLGVTAEVEQSPLADGYLFKWLAETAEGDEGETFYAFQLWREGQDGSPLVDETGLRETGLVLTALEPGVYVWRVAAIQAVEEGLLKVWGPDQRLAVSE
ncbi:FecR domain-containing protein [Erythrobacter sp. SDW2]|uniref:FecR family protein n=1 Tax=Erythrobacter sp. SDW2 TaxID=2907154 RepID=UPI001F18E034|nr:FecR domain-containing protein [Erythrobacter sp. SDW2]UIP06875.1 FecR domain-containing protein [Erythrobacter sp. SDW2]